MKISTFLKKKKKKKVRDEAEVVQCPFKFSVVLETLGKTHYERFSFKSEVNYYYFYERNKSPKKNENKTNLNTKCHLLQNADTTL